MYAVTIAPRFYIVDFSPLDLLTITPGPKAKSYKQVKGGDVGWRRMRMRGVFEEVDISSGWGFVAN